MQKVGRVKKLKKRINGESGILSGAISEARSPRLWRDPVFMRDISHNCKRVTSGCMKSSVGLKLPITFIFPH
jgi:hypothetical protein